MFYFCITLNIKTKMVVIKMAGDVKLTAAHVSTSLGYKFGGKGSSPPLQYSFLDCEKKKQI